MEDNICIPCMLAKKVNKQLQETQFKARQYMVEHGLKRIELVKNVHTDEYDFCAKDDPRLFTDFIHIETLLC